MNAHVVRRHNDPMDLVELAHTVQQADKFLRATTGGKLQVIVDQIRFLQQQVSPQLQSLVDSVVSECSLTFYVRLMTYWRRLRETASSIMLPVTSPKCLATYTISMNAQMKRSTSPCSLLATGAALAHTSFWDHTDLSMTIHGLQLNKLSHATETSKPSTERSSLTLGLGERDFYCFQPNLL